MPTTKGDLTRLTVTQLAQLCGRKPETIRRLLDGLRPVQQDARSKLYDSRAALDRVYGGAGLNPTMEKARLDRARAEKTELELKRLRGELVPADDQRAALIALATIVKDRVLSIGARTAPELAQEQTAAGCQAIVDRETRAALEDLAAAGEAASRRTRKQRTSQGAPTYSVKSCV